MFPHVRKHALRVPSGKTSGSGERPLVAVERAVRFASFKHSQGGGKK